MDAGRYRAVVAGCEAVKGNGSRICRRRGVVSCSMTRCESARRQYIQSTWQHQ